MSTEIGKAALNALKSYDKDTFIFGLIALLTFVAAPLIGVSDALTAAAGITILYALFRYVLQRVRYNEQRDALELEAQAASNKLLAKHVSKRGAEMIRSVLVKSGAKE